MSDKVVVVGAGPAGLMAAETAARAGKRVVVADGSPSPARKFLLAGRGGLNLTHSEPLDVFLDRYGASRKRLEPAMRAFDPEALRRWAERLGEPTFVGSSGRVFPKSFKSTPLLRAWLRSLQGLGVELRLRHRWLGFSPDGARFATPEGERVLDAGAYVLALGGASWPRLGGDGAWVEVLSALGVGVEPLKPANVGFKVDWSETFRQRFAGEPLKAMAFGFAGRLSRAEAVVSRQGLEGGALYALSGALRPVIEAEGAATLIVDLKPDWSGEKLAEALRRPPGASLSNFLRKAARLSPVAIGLLREAGTIPESSAALAGRIKACPVRLIGVGSLARAISTAGGIRWDEIDENFMLREKARRIRRRRDDRLGSADRRLPAAGMFFDRRRRWARRRRVSVAEALHPSTRSG